MNKCIDCAHHKNLRSLRHCVKNVMRTENSKRRYKQYYVWRVSCSLGSKNPYLPRHYFKKALGYNHEACKLFKEITNDATSISNSWLWH